MRYNNAWAVEFKWICDVSCPFFNGGPLIKTRARCTRIIQSFSIYKRELLELSTFFTCRLIYWQWLLSIFFFFCLTLHFLMALKRISVMWKLKIATQLYITIFLRSKREEKLFVLKKKFWVCFSFSTSHVFEALAFWPLGGANISHYTIQCRMAQF